MEKKRVSDYNKRQEDIFRRKKMREIELQKSMEEKIMEQERREHHLVETKTRFESRNEEYKSHLSEKLGKINERINKKKSENMKDAMVKFDLMSVRREDKYENVLRNEMVQEYLREKKLSSIFDRMKKKNRRNEKSKDCNS